MPEWWPTLLLVVFATHMPVFAWRWVRTRAPRHAATTITFALLTVSYALRVFAPDARLGDWPVSAWVRVPAWIAAVLSIGLLLRHLLTRRKTGG